MPSKSKSWLKDWKNIATALAIVASAWASVRSEMAKGDADTARGKAAVAQVDVKIAKKDANNSATAVLAVLNQRLAHLEETEKEIRIHMVAMNQRDKYMERMLWELYRKERGVRAADRVASEAPPAPEPLLLISHDAEPVPKNAAAAKAQYQRACDAGDPMCAVALE